MYHSRCFDDVQSIALYCYESMCCILIRKSYTKKRSYASILHTVNNYLQKKRASATVLYNFAHTMFSGKQGGGGVRALTFHQFVRWSIPGPGNICGLSLSFVLYSALRRLYFSGYSISSPFGSPVVYLPPTNGWITGPYYLCVTSSTFYSN